MCLDFFFAFYISNELKISPAAQKIADSNNFVIKSYGFEAIKEDLRKPRIVRIGAVQASIVEPTSAPVSVQREKIFEKIGKIIEAAAADNVNILCLHELWSKFMIRMSYASKEQSCFGNILLIILCE